jgi:hypothetical protein
MARMLYAYGDETGIEGNASYCLIMGYIGGADMWEEFRRDWSATLGKYGLEEFHAQRFFAQGSKKQQSVQCLSSLLAIIEHYNPTVIGHAVDVNAFQALTHDERRFLTGGLVERQTGKWLTSGKPSSAYPVAFSMFIGDSLRVASNDTLVHFVFDRQNVVQGYATKMFEEMKKRIPGREKMQSITFSKSQMEPGLQAADLLAYIWYKWMNGREKTSRQILDVMRVLLNGRDHIGLLDSDEMQKKIGQLHAKLGGGNDETFG